MFNLKKQGAPLFEAVTVDELKAHCRVSHSVDDDYIAGVVVRARDHFEQDVNIAVVGQSYKWYTESAFTSRLCLPIQPVLSITEITYTDEFGDPATLDEANYTFKSYRDPPEIVFGNSMPVGTEVVVEFIAGYDEDEVPARIKQAIQFLAANWYETREPIVIGSIVTAVPLAYERIVSRLRVKRFR